jgi:hypothetical protein
MPESVSVGSQRNTCCCACPARRSGNTPAGPGPARPSSSAIRLPPIKPITTGIFPMPAVPRARTGGKPSTSEPYRPTPGASTRCTATSGIGARTGTAITPKARCARSPGAGHGLPARAARRLLGRQRQVRALRPAPRRRARHPDPLHWLPSCPRSNQPRRGEPVSGEPPGAGPDRGERSGLGQGRRRAAKAWHAAGPKGGIAQRIPPSRDGRDEMGLGPLCLADTEIRRRNGGYILRAWNLPPLKVAPRYPRTEVDIFGRQMRRKPFNLA